MSERIKTDLCVIGGGSGGLSVAAGAVQMGAKTVLVEGGKMGGDCLNYGCIPSKALRAAAKKAVALDGAAAFGIEELSPGVNFAAVMDHVRSVIDQIAPHDSVERFTRLGVKVIQSWGRFVSPTELEAGGYRIEAKKFVIATGSSPAIPPIEGLAEVPYFTNETIFQNTQRPDHLIIIGGGPIGMEMAQAHRRLGAKVTVLEAFKALGADDPELTAIVISNLRAEGVIIHEGVKIKQLSGSAAGGIDVHLETSSGGETLRATHLLVAAGRRPNIDRLDLAAANIDYTTKGITVDQRLRSSNKRVYAIGDVAGGYQFTHVAGYQAGIAIRNILFKLPAKVDYSALPWVTYTDPEMANVGLGEAAAREKYGDSIRVLSAPMRENDRAIAERKTEGLLKVVVTKRGRILGAAMAGPHAGEVIQPWITAIAGGLKIRDMASFIAPYPTFGEINKRAAGSFYTSSLFSQRTRTIVKWLMKLG